MSKGGLIGHFDSKEDLQINILQHAFAGFREAVMEPVSDEADGQLRLQTLFMCWIAEVKDESSSAGRLIFSAAAEFGDRPGPVRECALNLIAEFTAALKTHIQYATKDGSLSKDTDIKQFLFEWQSIMLGYHQYLKMGSTHGLMKKTEKAFDSLLERFSD